MHRRSHSLVFAPTSLIQASCSPPLGRGVLVCTSSATWGLRLIYHTSAFVHIGSSFTISIAVSFRVVRDINV